jgi:hypothetical protein
MNQFNPLAKCPKCGHDKVETSYKASLDQLDRSCERCFYTWPEAPLDRNTGTDDSQALERISKAVYAPPIE